MDESGRSLPEVPNGRPELAIGALSRQDAIDHPEDSRARMQVVLKTMTRKLTQKKRIMRQVQVRRTDLSAQEELEDTEMEVDRQLGSRSAGTSSKNSPSNSIHALPPSSKTAPSSPGVERKSGRSGFRSSPSSPRQGASEQLGNTFQRAFSKARSTFRNASGSGIKDPEGMRERMKSNSSDVTMASVSGIDPSSSPPLSSPTGEDFPYHNGTSTPRPRMPFVRSPPSSPDPNLNGYGSFQSHPNTLPPSTAENGSVRGKKRRNRALSITSMRSFASRTHTHVQSNSHTSNSGGSSTKKGGMNHGSDGETEALNFPRQHLVKNLHHFMRFASASYGQNFMRILGIGVSVEESRACQVG